MKKRPLKIFFCYSHKDRRMRTLLDDHLELLRREGLVTTWHDGEITPGTDWSQAIQETLNGADLIIFLVSSAFLNSKYIAEVEMHLALEAHEKGTAVVVPVLLEQVDAFKELPLEKLQTLPAPDNPICDWDDQVRALDYVVVGIRRAAMHLIVNSGGSFEFWSHQFSEAELKDIEPAERSRTLDDLKRLRSQLVDSVPQRIPDGNLLVANWCLNKFGRELLHPGSLFYLAQVISAFDIVSLQEIDRNIKQLQELIKILGPEWGYLITDITEGILGNQERYAIIYYEPRVTFEHISGEVILPDKMLIDGKQFARKPLVASFRSGEFRFRTCVAHIHFGSNKGPRRKTGIRECEVLAKYLSRIAGRDKENIILAGNFNIQSPDSPAVNAFTKQDFAIPPHTLHPSSALGDHYYDMIGFRLGKEARVNIGRSASIDIFESVFRPEDKEVYTETVEAYQKLHSSLSSHSKAYNRWRVTQISDHLPIWVELKFP